MLVLHFSDLKDYAALTHSLAIDDFTMNCDSKAKKIELDTNNESYISNILYEDKPGGTVVIQKVDKNFVLDEVPGAATVKFQNYFDSCNLVSDLASEGISFSFDVMSAKVIVNNLPKCAKNFISKYILENDFGRYNLAYFLEGATYDKDMKTIRPC